jgi:hypothetical protein
MQPEGVIGLGQEDEPEVRASRNYLLVNSKVRKICQSTSDLRRTIGDNVVVDSRRILIT